MHKSGGISRSIFNFIPFWFRVAKKEVKLCTEKDSLPNPTFLLGDTLYVSTLLKVSSYAQISVQGPSDTTTQLAMAAGGWLPLAVCGCIVSFRVVFMMLPLSACEPGVRQALSHGLGIDPPAWNLTFFYIFIYFRFGCIGSEWQHLRCSVPASLWLWPRGSERGALQLWHLGLVCSKGCGLLVPGPGIEPPSPALEGGF